MLKIRLQRVGRKHESAFRVVLTDSKNSTKSGKFHEILGSYNPKIDKVELKADRIKHWIGNGAKPTDTVHNILINQKVIEGEKRNVLPKKKPIVNEEQQKESEAKPEGKKTEETEDSKDEPKEESVEASKENKESETKPEDTEKPEDKKEDTKPEDSDKKE